MTNFRKVNPFIQIHQPDVYSLKLMKSEARVPLREVE